MEERLMGGGHYVCEKCGVTVFGSVIYYCDKDKIKGNIKEIL
jgi:hypothetical protein